MLKYETTKKGTKMKPQLSTVDIHKWYGSVHALNGVNFEVYPGEIIGLLGDNGAGKSTLVKILSGAIPKNRGAIYWEGKQTEISSVYEARKLGIETVYQDQAVVNDMSVAQNIFLGRELKKRIGIVEILDKKRMEKKAAEITQYLGLQIATPKQEVRFCSGGERQGIAIARAIFFKAKLIILDEPTTALSVRGSEVVLNFVTQLKTKGISSIIVTHNVYHAYSIADRFVIMSMGEIVDDVSRNDITQNQLIAKLAHRSD